jgi:ATP-dependent DNA ligase
VLSVDGEDVCALPLIERKRRLRRIMPKVDTRLLYLDSIAERDAALYRGCGPWVRLKIDPG